MTTILSEEDLAQEALRDELIRLEELHLAREHPAFLLHHVTCVDSRSGEIFEFQVLSGEEYDLLRAKARDTGWYWQRELLDWWMAEDQTIVLKGRQLGVTWVACGLALWYLLFKPGSDVLVYSIKEEDAKEVIGRIWDMLESLRGNPRLQHLLNGGKVIKPSKSGVRPSEGIEVEHTIDGIKRISSIHAMSSSSSSGHGRSAALVIFDEASRQPNARITWKAVVPASGDKGGKILVISTANGMSEEKTGEGNFFHFLWAKAGSAVFPKLKRKFLRWSLHPERDEDWYQSVSLDANDKAEQYPNDADEAFLLSGSPYLDVEALKYYAKKAKAESVLEGFFEHDPKKPNSATFRANGPPYIAVYKKPEAGRKYAIFADIATGHGLDYSVAAVIDLHTGAPCAEIYMQADYDDFARQLHFLGIWFNTARIAPEKGGGYGDTVIAYLRDGHEGRRPYPKLYRHRRYDRPDKRESVMFGFPMTPSTRPKVISELRRWINDRMMPFVTPRFLVEARTFVYRDKKPSPAAADGCNDDVVIAWAGALELYSQFGEHPHDRRKRTRERAKTRKKPVTASSTLT